MNKEDLCKFFNNADDLGKNEKLIYLYLALNTNDNNAAWKRYRDISKHCNIASNNAISKALKKLEELKYIKVYKHRNGRTGRQSTNTYYIIPRKTDEKLRGLQ